MIGGWTDDPIGKWQTVYLSGFCGHKAQIVAIGGPEPFTVYAGGKMDMDLSAMKDMDVQVSLCDTSMAPYSQGFRGRIWYTPAPDGGVWPLEVYKQTLGDIKQAALDGKKVLIYCLGGHGRTGTMLAGLVGLYEGAKDPIGAVRKRYCREAIEGWQQCELVYKVMGKPTPDRYSKEKGWWEYADIAKVGTARTYGANPTTGRTDMWVHPEAATTGPFTVKTQYGSIQQWGDKHGPPPGYRIPPLVSAPGESQIRAALTERYGDLNRLSSLVKRILGSSTLQAIHGYTTHLWWVYGDMIPEPTGARWECFIMYWGHPSILDGHITMEYGRTQVAPTITGRITMPIVVAEDPLVIGGP